MIQPEGPACSRGFRQIGLINAEDTTSRCIPAVTKASVFGSGEAPNPIGLHHPIENRSLILGKWPMQTVVQVLCTQREHRDALTHPRPDHFPAERRKWRWVDVCAVPGLAAHHPGKHPLWGGKSVGLHARQPPQSAWLPRHNDCVHYVVFHFPRICSVSRSKIARFHSQILTSHWKAHSMECLYCFSTGRSTAVMAQNHVNFFIAAACRSCISACKAP